MRNIASPTPRAALPFPQGFDAVKAAALPETFFTVWHNVFYRGGLRRGETFLVHGGTSGIGTTAIQVAKAFGATGVHDGGQRGEMRAHASASAPMSRSITARRISSRWSRSETEGKGVDFILDMVGGDYIQKNLNCVADDGRIHQIAFLNGPKATVDFTRLMIRRITYTGSTLRPRPMAGQGPLARGLEDQVWPLLAGGKIAPIIDSTFALEKAADAHGAWRAAPISARSC